MEVVSGGAGGCRFRQLPGNEQIKDFSQMSEDRDIPSMTASTSPEPADSLLKPWATPAVTPLAIDRNTANGGATTTDSTTHS